MEDIIPFSSQDPQTNQFQLSPEQIQEEQRFQLEQMQLQQALEVKNMVAQANYKNLVPLIDEDTLKKIGNTVIEEYKIDIDSRAEWEKRRVSWLKLFAGVRGEKNNPWEKCSNVHIPFMGMASLQFQSRAYEALLPSKEIMTAVSTDGKSIAQAERITKHMNWQLFDDMDDWEDDTDSILLLLPISGVAFKKTYYDFTLKKVVSGMLTTDELVIPYKCKRLQNAPRLSHVLWFYPDDLKIREKNGLFTNVSDLGFGSQDITPSKEMQNIKDKIEGRQTPAINDKTLPRMAIEQHRKLDLNNDGIGEDYVVTVDYETNRVMRIIPNLYIDPITEEEKKIEYFTSYSFIPNPDSIYGYGFGHLIEGLNESANTLINQLIDAGHLANLASGFVSRRSGVKKGDLKFKLGEYKEIDVMTDDIRKAIYTHEFKEPSTALFSLLGLLEKYAQQITSVSETMMGQLPPSDTTATAMLGILEQGMKVFSSIQRRIHKSLKRELKKIFILNSLYLDEKKYFMIQDSTSESMIGYTIGRVDYLNSIDVIPVSDPNIISRAEKIAIAQQSYQMGLQNPIVINNPVTMAVLTRNFYKAIGNEEIAKTIEIPKPEKPPDIPPQEENAMFLKEQGSQALPEQDHINHFQSHEVFKNSSWNQFLTPQGKKLIDAHQKEHIAFSYLIGMGGLPDGGMEQRGMAGMERAGYNTVNPSTSQGTQTEGA